VNVVFFLLGDIPTSKFSVLTFRNTLSSFTGLSKRPVKLEQGVPKRRHRKFRRQDITQKKEYNKEEFVVTVMLTPVLNM
jgi:hypothetical protein